MITTITKMGNQPPSKYLYFDSEQQFWINYYNQTGDYSVGNSTTLKDERQKAMSDEVLKKWTIEPGKYHFPDPEHFYICKGEINFWKIYYKQTGDYSVGCMATVTSDKESNRQSNIKSSEILKRWKTGHLNNTFYFPKCL